MILDAAVETSHQIIEKTSFLKKLFRRKQHPLISIGNNLDELASGLTTVDLYSDNWKKKDFDVTDQLESTEGSIVEFAGPTPAGYQLVDIHKLKDPMYVSNIFPGLPKWNRVTGELDRLDPGIHFQADARQMPLADESCKAVLVSCLEKELRQETVKEAMRVLKPGGLLIWQGGMIEDFQYAQDLGLTLQQFIHNDQSHKDENQNNVEFHLWNCIFLKPNNSKSSGTHGSNLI